MNKVYQYRKHIQWGQYVLFVLFLLGLVFSVILGISSFQLWRAFNPESPIPVLFILVICLISLIPPILEFPVWYLYYRMAGVRVIIDNDTIIYKHRRGETRIDFAKITKIGLPSIPYLGGWITIVAGKEKFRLTVVVSEIGDFVQTLKASLDKIGLANRYNESKLFLFFKTAVFSDQSWDRIYSLFWKLIVATLGIGGLGVVIEIISNNGGFLWLYLSFAFPTLVYIFTEIVFGVRIAKTSIRESFFVPPRDVAYENSVYKLDFCSLKTE